MNRSPSSIQLNYYEKTAQQYDEMHVATDDEHQEALYWLSSLILRYNIKSVLDVGCGTGRVQLFLRDRHPDVQIVGLEPSSALRLVAVQKGVSEDSLVDGSALTIPFPDTTFDLVCSFGVLHHLDRPDLAVKEYIRVARHSVFISDSNNFGQGSVLARLIKNSLRIFRLWKAYIYLATGGRKYRLSDGDGLFYSYSLFNDLKQTR